jgi:hypothetical protein
VCEVTKKFTGDAKTFVDLEGAIDVWVVDEAFPANSSPRFL